MRRVNFVLLGGSALREHQSGLVGERQKLRSPPGQWVLIT